MSVDLQRHELVKCRLRMAGLSLTIVARDLRVSQSTVTVVSQGYRTSHRIQKAIACALGEPVEKLYRERYDRSLEIEENPKMRP